MSSNSGLFGPSAPVIRLSPEEKQFYGQLFRQADPDFTQVVTGDSALQLFVKSGLSQAVLGEIWQLADPDDKGFLDQAGFSVALRIIGHVQKGQRPASNLADIPGPLPVFEGSRPPVNPSSTGQSGSLPPISPADKTTYVDLFNRNASSGLLDGGDARNIFLKSGLSTEALIQVWNLCDTQKRGQLDQAEFVLAMHLLRSLITQTIRQLPSVLPPNTLELIRSARVATRVSSTSSNTGPSRFGQQPPHSPAEQRSTSLPYTGALQNPPLRQQAQPQLTGQVEWVITPQDRAKFESIFNNLDKSKSGIIGAEEVVPFLTTSNLSEDALAQVWDLADIHNTGRFGKDEFSIAMYLVQQQLVGKKLPPTLPASLYPNANEVVPQTVSPKPPVSSSLNDLLSLGDALGSSSQNPPISTPQLEKSVQPHLTGTRAPFVPTSSFGQSISQKPDTESLTPVQVPSATGVPVSAPIPQFSQQSSQLLNDPDYSNKLTTLSTENANLTNQVNSMSTQADQAIQKKNQAEGELARVLAIKADLQSRLASLRSEYDSQIKKSTEAQQLLHETKKETEKLTSEYSILEASYHAVKSQCQEISNQLVADQQKNSDLKDKISFLNEETAGLKQTLEKLQKEAKQQSGFVSINKKQFAFAESERDKIQTQISQTQESITREALASGISESSSIPGFTSIGSPSRISSVSSPISSTNPFLSSFSQPVNQPVTFNETAAAPFNATFEDRFNQLGISSPTTTVEPARSSTHNTEDTPNSSPPSSDFQYNPNNAPIPSFTLPLGRPESTTSSVQNNPSMSVRGDIDISRPDSPDMTVSSEPVSGTLPSEELAERATNFSTSQLPIPPDSLNPINDQTLRQSSALSGSVNSSSGSFEIVPHHTEDPNNPLSLNGHVSPSSESIETAKNVIRSSGPDVSNVTTSAPQTLSNNNESSMSQDSRTQFDSTVDSMNSSGGNPWSVAPKTTGEFPPIKELEYDDDSSSSDDEVNNTAASVSVGPSNPTSSAAAPPLAATTTQEVTSAQGTQVPSFMTSPKEADPFDAAFDGLEEAKEENVPVNTFGNSPFAVNSSPAPASSSAISQAPFGNSSIPASSAQNTHTPASTANLKETDPFDAAFDKLEQAQEETAPVNTFSNSPFAAGGRAPSVTSQAFGSPQPAHGFNFGSAESKVTSPSNSKPSVFDSFPIDSSSSQNNAAPASKDEWDSIFAGFGKDNATKPVASANDINNAFGNVTSGQQQPQLPLPASTPNSQAVENLVKMGFDKVQARNALEKTNFNVEDASNYLLDH